MKTKESIFEDVEKEILSQGFRILSKDQTRPWGGFFVIDETQAQKFSDIYFKGLDTDSLKISGKLSPKILVVAPEKRLSWQYHHRRAEIWTVVDGPVAVVKSDTDAETEPQTYNEGDTIRLQQGERHRLVGLSNWGVLAEIWQHTDATQPSDEEDIVRVQDDFGR